MDGLYNSQGGSPRLRFPEFEDCWQQYTYGDLFHISASRNADYSISRILSASQTRGMIERAEIDIDIKFEQESTRTYKIVHSGDYIVHLRSFQGGFAFSDRGGICSPAYTVLRSSNLLEYGFLKDYFMSENFIKMLRIVTYGIRDGRSISVEEFLKLCIDIPSKDEQSKISKVITAIDDKINDESEVCASFIRQKQYLLRNMFI